MERNPVWGYQDLLLLLGFAFPSLIVSVLLARLIPGLSKAMTGLLGQLLWYVLICLFLAAIFRYRYHRNFWNAIAWNYPFAGVPLTLAAGPPLAIAIGALGYALHTPTIKLPFEQMLADRPTTVLFSLFVVILGPMWEEIVFRGFLLPLLTRNFGIAVAIALTAIVFGSIHAPEYDWSWRHVMLVSLAGAVFGWVRHATGSTLAAVFIHGTYNLTELAGFLSQNT